MFRPFDSGNQARSQKRFLRSGVIQSGVRRIHEFVIESQFGEFLRKRQAGFVFLFRKEAKKDWISIAVRWAFVVVVLSSWDIMIIVVPGQVFKLQSSDSGQAAGSKQ